MGFVESAATIFARAQVDVPNAAPVISNRHWRPIHRENDRFDIVSDGIRRGGGGVGRFKLYQKNAHLERQPSCSGS
jgi:hypothetical protein